MTENQVLRTEPASIDTGEFLFQELFEDAEAVRWQFGNIDWSEVDLAKVDLTTINRVESATQAEYSTWQATRSFMDLFYDDPDFTQWISVWFYEETKHPHVLSTWLKRVGLKPSRSDVVAYREITPMLGSRLGTLAINVIAEMAASQAYLSIGRNAREPVIRGITLNLAGDEARHGSHFLRYAQTYLENSIDHQADLRLVLKILYLWLSNPQSIEHPGNLQFGLSGPYASAEEYKTLQSRVCRLFSIWLALPAMENVSDVREALRDASPVHIARRR